MYERPVLDRYQDIVSQSYGSPVNPTQNVNGVIELRNPLDDKILATVPAGAGDPDVSKVEWSENVEHDDSKVTDQFRGWNAYGNKTTDEHRPSPDGEHKETTDGVTQTNEAPIEGDSGEVPADDNGGEVPADGDGERLTPDEEKALETSPAVESTPATEGSPVEEELDESGLKEEDQANAPMETAQLEEKK